YPSRDTRIALFKDLVIAFGNPFLHNPDPARQYLASDSEPARLRVDDRFGSFQIPQNPRGFFDGNDVNHDGAREVSESPTAPTDVLLAALGSRQTIAPGSTGTLVGDRTLADLDGDGVYDVGDGLVVNASEPFDDANGNGVFDPGETFSDVGLDGVAGTGDFGEGNGMFDVDPDRAHWLAADPESTLCGQAPAQRTPAAIQLHGV